MDKLRLVICDIDSTLVDSKRILTKKTHDVIEQLHQKGIYFGIASGRPLDELNRYPEDWNLSFKPEFLIGMNGSEVWDGVHQKEYGYFKLKPEWMKEIIELMEPFDVNGFIYTNGHILSMKNDEMIQKSAKTSHKAVVVANDVSEFYQEENAKIMFRMDQALMSEVEDYVAKHPSPHYSAFKTQTTLLEFADSRISKAYGLKKICDENDFDLENVMAFGDTSNDNEMLKVSGLGVCMINGSQDTKDCADDITKFSNDEDGVGRYLEDNGWI